MKCDVLNCIVCSVTLIMNQEVGLKQSDGNYTGLRGKLQRNVRR